MRLQGLFLNTMQNLFFLGLLSTIYACSHPIEIVGEGDVLSPTGTRNCYREDFQAKKEHCTKNLAQGAYNETYSLFLEVAGSLTSGLTTVRTQSAMNEVSAVFTGTTRNIAQTTSTQFQNTPS